MTDHFSNIHRGKFMYPSARAAGFSLQVFKARYTANTKIIFIINEVFSLFFCQCVMLAPNVAPSC